MKPPAPATALAPESDPMRPGAAGLLLRGAAMGAADLVPGVSGGTIALLTGIYQPLLRALRAFGPGAAKVLLRDGPAACWHYLNGSFLLFLALGIAGSILSLARLVHWLLERHPLPSWAFLFGLILGCALALATRLPLRRQPQLGVLLLLGAMALWLATDGQRLELPATGPWLFLGGAAAICAMLLPGISGSFVLLLLGLYEPVLGAIRFLEPGLLGTFGAGCLLALVIFPRLLLAAFNRFPQTLPALLAGLVWGSLPLLWPWSKMTPDSGGNQLIAILALLLALTLVLTLEKRYQASRQAMGVTGPW